MKAAGVNSAFLKYAKLYEREQFDRHGHTLLPEGAPRLEPSRSVEAVRPQESSGS